MSNQEEAKDLFLKGEIAKENKKFEKAIEYYQKSANMGYAEAQLALGICYNYGLTVSEDLKKAVEWYKKSAEQDNADAQNNLGICYETGKGVNKDITKALEWYKKASDLGNKIAKENYKRLKK